MAPVGIWTSACRLYSLEGSGVLNAVSKTRCRYPLGFDGRRGEQLLSHDQLFVTFYVECWLQQ